MTRPARLLKGRPAPPFSPWPCLLDLVLKGARLGIQDDCTRPADGRAACLQQGEVLQGGGLAGAASLKRVEQKGEYKGQSNIRFTTGQRNHESD